MPRKSAAIAVNPFALWTDLALKTTEMLAASAQVITHRTGRMAKAGPSPSLRDRREFTKMGAEKVEAIGESAWAMAQQLSKTQADLGLRAWQDMMKAGTAWMSFAGSKTLPQVMARQSKLMQTMTQSAQSAGRVSDAAARVTKKGLKPVHSRAVANAKRLVK